MTLASFWNIMKQFQTNLALIMTIHFARDCVEMVRCSSVFRMSSIFAETSVSRTKKTLRGNWKVMFTHIWLSQPVQLWETARGFFVQQHWTLLLQVILFEIDCTIFYTIFFCQFITWTNWVNPGKFMDNCWLSCQAMAKFMTIS